MEKKPSYYTILPATIRYDNELTPIAKLLFSEILTLSATNGYCHATNEYFAKLYGVEHRTIQRAIALLREKNYIITEAQYKDKKVVGRHLKIDKLVVTKMSLGGDKNVTTRGDKNVTYNNINNNNINNNIGNRYFSDNVIDFEKYYANLEG